MGKTGIAADMGMAIYKYSKKLSMNRRKVLTGLVDIIHSNDDLSTGLFWLIILKINYVAED